MKALCSFSSFQRVLLVSPALFLTYLIRFQLGPIPTNLLEVVICVFFTWWLYGIWKLDFPRPMFANRWQWLAPSLFILTATAATIWTVTQLDAEFIKVPLGIWKGWFVAPAAYFLMLISTFKRRSDWEMLMEISLGITGLTAALLMMQFATGIFSSVQSTYDFRLVWPYLDPWTGLGASGNYPALFLAPFLCMAFLKASLSPAPDSADGKGWIEKVYLWTVVLALSVAIYLTKSYGAWLAVIGTCALLSFFLVQGKKRWVFIPLTTLVLLGGLYLDQRYSEKFIFATDQEVQTEQTLGSGEERRNIWNVSTDLIHQSPFWGVGVGQFQRAFEEQAPITLRRPVSQQEIDHALHPHNTFLMFWLSTGILGLLAFLFLLGVWSVPLFRLEDRGLRFLLLAPLLYLMVHGLIEVVYWKNDLAYSFWFFGALMTLAQNFTTITGKVEHGLKIGRELGFPTANIALDATLDIPHGVYVVSVQVGKIKKKGLLYFGPRLIQGLPNDLLCEITILDFEEDLYDQKMKFQIGAFIRGPKRFSSTEDLKKQIEKDVIVARNRVG